MPTRHKNCPPQEIPNAVVLYLVFAVYGSRYGDLLAQEDAFAIDFDLLGVVAMTRHTDLRD